MADQGLSDPRPLSPHLQVWKFHPTMLSSILHRATGVANSIGIILIVGWFFAAGLGEDAYVQFDAILSSIPAKIVLFGFTISILYHLINGVRHLVWDMGHGFSPKVADFWAFFAIIGSLVGAVAIWFAAGLVPGV